MEKTRTRTFDTGSKRTTDADETRYDLISEIGLERLSKTYARGASKYTDHNWRKGQPFSVVLNHVLSHINQYKQGDASEDHLAHAAWGLFALLEFSVTRPELNDLYAYTQKEAEVGGHPCAATNQEPDSCERHTQRLQVGPLSASGSAAG